MDETLIADFMDQAYGAVLAPQAWPQVLEAFARLVGGHGSALIWQNQADRSGQGIIVGVDPEILPAYFGAFARRHPSQRWINSPAERLRHFVPRIVADDDAMPKSELMRTPFYNEFMRPFDLHTIVRIGLASAGHDAAFLMVTRPRSRERFEDPELKVMRHLHSHLTRAFELSQRSPAAQSKHDVAETVLERSDAALLVVDAEGKVLHANPAATALLAGDCGLRLVGGRLSAPLQGEAARLHQLIALAGSPDAGRRQGGAMGLTTPSRKLPLSVTITPLGPEPLPIIRARRAVLVSIIDLESAGALSQQRLRQLFGLSRTEAMVASALYEGDTPKEAAERLGVSAYTVRSHLAHIFEKTGVRRQAELVRLISGLASA